MTMHHIFIIHVVELLKQKNARFCSSNTETPRKVLWQWAIPVNENTPPWKNKLAFTLKIMKLLAYYLLEPIKSSVLTPKDQS